jgi:hypothetical protein
VLRLCLRIVVQFWEPGDHEPSHENWVVYPYLVHVIIVIIILSRPVLTVFLGMVRRVN